MMSNTQTGSGPNNKPPGIPENELLKENITSDYDTTDKEPVTKNISTDWSFMWKPI